jgi:hypothetical protein
MFPFYQCVSLGIIQIKLKTAKLGAFAAIGAAAEAVLRCVTLSAVTDAQGTVNETF